MGDHGKQVGYGEEGIIREKERMWSLSSRALQSGWGENTN